MIAVIADDLTGAAELGGIGSSLGLNVEVSFTVNSESKADLLVIATDTRAKPESEAVAEMTEVTRLLAELKPEFIFKKVDSVLRGHVVSELRAQLSVLGFDSALLVPANPALGRTIENGSYFIDGLPIAETSFAADPEFPAKSSAILRLLNVSDGSVHVKKYEKVPLEKGITVAEVTCDADLKNWTNVFRSNVLLAGGSGFFKAVLDKAVSNAFALSENDSELGETMLYVCGSAYNASTGLVYDVASAGGPVSYMPQTLVNDPENSYKLEKWSDEVVDLIALRHKAIIAIKTDLVTILSPFQIKNIMARLVEKVFDKLAVSELIIEGGSTASAVLKSLGIKTLYPVKEFATGIIRCKAAAPRKLFVTLKPGSYTWPNQVWQF